MNNVVAKALNLAPVIYTKPRGLSTEDAVIMQNRDLSSKVDDVKEEDVLKYLNNLTSELKSPRTFCSPFPIR